MSLREVAHGQWTRRSAAVERLRARAPRYVFVGLVGILCLIGLRELVAPEPVPAPPNVDINVDQAAEQLAQRFARAYLSADLAHPGPRERELASMLPTDLDPSGGFTPERSSRQVTLTEVAQNQEALAGGRIIVVYAETNDGEHFYLAVPIERATGGAMAISGYPSFVGPPVVSRRPTSERTGLEDLEILEVARRALANYLANSERNLRADLAPGAEISLPPNPLRMAAVEDANWADGPASGAVLLTVSAVASDRSSYELTYELGVTGSAGRTLITFIEVVPTST